MSLLNQEAINVLASKYNLISNPIHENDEGDCSVFLERDEADGRYSQAHLKVTKHGVFCHAGLFRERSIINDGTSREDSVEQAVANAVSRFNRFVDSIPHCVVGAFPRAIAKINTGD